MGFWQDITGQTQADAYRQAAQIQSQGLQNAFTQQQPYYQSTLDALKTGYGGAINAFQPGYNLGVGGSSAYADATGANGPEGQARALAQFQTDPGYQFIRNQALDATQRVTGTGGFQNSGNVLTALQDRAAGLADQSYSSYVNRLQPFLGYSTTTAGQLGGANIGQGTDLANAYGAEGNLGYNTTTGAANALAAGMTGAANAQAAASGGLLNAGLKVAGMALAPFTGGASLASTLLGFGGSTGGGGVGGLLGSTLGGNAAATYGANAGAPGGGYYGTGGQVYPGPGYY